MRISELSHELLSVRSQLEETQPVLEALKAEHDAAMLAASESHSEAAMMKDASHAAALEELQAEPERILEHVDVPLDLEQPKQPQQPDEAKRPQHAKA